MKNTFTDLTPEFKHRIKIVRPFMHILLRLKIIGEWHQPCTNNNMIRSDLYRYLRDYKWTGERFAKYPR